MTDAQKETLATMMLEVPMAYWVSLSDWGIGLMLAADGTFYIDDSLHSATIPDHDIRNESDDTHA